jgi:hypothetical protein
VPTLLRESVSRFVTIHSAAAAAAAAYLRHTSSPIMAEESSSMRSSQGSSSSRRAPKNVRTESLGSPRPSRTTVTDMPWTPAPAAALPDREVRHTPARRHKATARSVLAHPAPRPIPHALTRPRDTNTMVARDGHRERGLRRLCPSRL